MNIVTIPKIKSSNYVRSVPLERRIEVKEGKVLDVRSSVLNRSRNGLNMSPLFVNVVDFVRQKNSLWLFGIREEGGRGESARARTVSIKVDFRAHFIYDGMMNISDIYRIKGVRSVEPCEQSMMCLYTNGAKKAMRRIYYDVFCLKSSIIKKLRAGGACTIYNDKILIPSLFFLETKTELFRIVRLDEYVVINSRRKRTSCDLELSVHPRHMTQIENNIPKIPLRVLDMDIESLDKVPDEGAIPRGGKGLSWAERKALKRTEPRDPSVAQSIQVGMILREDGLLDNVKKIMLVYSHDGEVVEKKKMITAYMNEKNSWGDTGGTVHVFATEIAMLEAFFHFYHKCDVIAGWNSIKFDLYYLYARADVHRRKDLMCLSRFKGAVTEVSWTGGKTVERFLETPGILQHDVMQSCKIQTNKGLASYKLTEVSKEYLNLEKKDLPWQQIAPKHVTNPEIIADYCIWDVELVSRIAETKDYLTSMKAISTMCDMPLTLTLMRAQQGKVFNVLTKYIVDANMVMNGAELQKKLIEHKFFPKKPDDQSLITGFFKSMGMDRKTIRKTKRRMGRITDKRLKLMKKEVRDKYPGGYVITPVPGLYHNVVVLDYAGLYPNIIIAHNLCFSNLVLDRAEVARLVAAGHDMFILDTPTAYCAFVRDYEGTILPKVLKKLLAGRAAAKKQMKGAKNSGDLKKVSIYNALQLAIKIVCNSAYGFVGADRQTGKFPCLPIAVAITHIGRNLIKSLRIYINMNVADGFVIYGDTDSVFVKFPDCWPPERVITRSESLAVELTNLPMHRNHLLVEFESLFINFLSFGKKMYGGGLYLGPELLLKEYFKGVMAVRRDSCDWARGVMGDYMRHVILESRGVEYALEKTREGLMSIFDTDLKSLSITCRINKDYKNENLVQCKVAKEIRERLGSFYAVEVGSRIRFVYQDGVESDTTSDWAIDYDLAVVKKVTPKYSWYIKRITNSLMLLATVTDCEGKMRSAIEHVESMVKRKAMNNTSISSFFKPSAVISY